jgi:hypothetical protein
MLVFFLALTLGFAFELGKNALKIDSRQNILSSQIANASLTNKKFFMDLGINNLRIRASL